MSTIDYYRAGFAPAFREVVAWVWRPPAWWGWIIAAPLYPFTAHIVLWLQCRDLRRVDLML